MREYIPYVLSGKDRTKRQTLDEWTGKRNKCYTLLYQRFIDPDFIVTLPTNRTQQKTKDNINRKFISTGKTWNYFNDEFNPNDLSRILLKRSEVSIKQILGSTISAYNTVMDDYTKNTGGGSGDDADIVTWQEREETDILNYDRKVKNSVYLTVVHMYDKSFAFPLLGTKEAFPVDFQIDDEKVESLSTLSTKRKSQVSSNDVYSGNNEHKAKLYSTFKTMYEDSNTTAALSKYGEEINKIRNFIDTCESVTYSLNKKKQKIEEQNEFEPYSVTEDDIDTIDQRIKTEKKLMKGFVRMLNIAETKLQNMLDKHEEE